MSSVFNVTLSVWSLETGKHIEKCNFKHPAPVQCVRINATTVYSSCARGLVKVWDLEKTALIRVRRSPSIFLHVLRVDPCVKDSASVILAGDRRTQELREVPVPGRAALVLRRRGRSGHGLERLQ